MPPPGLFRIATLNPINTFQQDYLTRHNPDSLQVVYWRCWVALLGKLEPPETSMAYEVLTFLNEYSLRETVLCPIEFTESTSSPERDFHLFITKICFNAGEPCRWWRGIDISMVCYWQRLVGESSQSTDAELKEWGVQVHMSKSRVSCLYGWGEHSWKKWSCLSSSHQKQRRSDARTVTIFG